VKRSIILAIGKQLLMWARPCSAERGSGVSSMLAGELRAMIERDTEYKRARTRGMPRLDSPLPSAARASGIARTSMTARAFVHLDQSRDISRSAQSAWRPLAEVDLAPVERNLKFTPRGACFSLRSTSATGC
jgi:hypothetical protein